MILENIPKSAEMVRHMHKGSLLLSFHYISSEERCWAIERIASYMRTFQEMGNVDPAVVTKVFNKRFKTHPATLALVDRTNKCLNKAFDKLTAHATHFGRKPLNGIQVEAGELGVMIYYRLNAGIYIQHIPAARLGEFSIRCEMIPEEIKRDIRANNYPKRKKK